MNFIVIELSKNLPIQDDSEKSEKLVNVDQELILGQSQNSSKVEDTATDSEHDDATNDHCFINRLYEKLVSRDGDEADSEKLPKYEIPSNNSLKQSK